jgi:hypothetical protein
MTKIIDASPAPFSRTDSAEAKSVNKLQNLLDAEFIKGSIKTSDKVPNIDGTLTVVTNEQSYHRAVRRSGKNIAGKAQL